MRGTTLEMSRTPPEMPPLGPRELLNRSRAADILGRDDLEEVDEEEEDEEEDEETEGYSE